MAGEASIRFEGTVTADPELRFTPSGDAVCNFTVAVNSRKKDATGSWVDDTAAFYRVAVWRAPGEVVAERVVKGDRVLVAGRLKPREYEHNGAQRTSLDVDADEVGLSLRFHPKGDRQPQTAGASSTWGPATSDPPF